MQKIKNELFTPRAVVFCDRILGLFVVNYSQLTTIKVCFQKNAWKKYQATHYIYMSILNMFQHKKSLSNKPKRKNSRIWKIRQFCKFWQPIVAFTTAILVFLLKLILMVWREFIAS